MVLVVVVLVVVVVVVMVVVVVVVTECLKGLIGVSRALPVAYTNWFLKD